MGLPKVAWILASTVVLVALAVQMAPGEEYTEWSYQQPDKSLLTKQSSIKDNGVLVQFSSRSETLAGRLFYPTNKTDLPPPVVVLAHGLGLSQDCSLTGFVEGFIKAGFAAFTFDYATFGASTGTPRHQVHPEHHIDDLMTAMATLRERSSDLQVDASRMALWGTSMGGGHVLRVAAAAQVDAKALRAVVAQIPHLASGAESVLGTLRRNPGSTTLALIKTLAAVIRWILQWSVWGKTWYLPLTGLPGSSGVMQNEGDFEGYLSLIPENGGLFGWRNAVTVPSLFRMLVYRPLNSVKDIQVPVLIIAAEKDTLCPAAYVETARQAIDRRDTEVMTLAGAEHFDLYEGALHEKSVAKTVDFLKKYLR